MDAIPQELLGPTIYTTGLGITGPGSHPVALLRELMPWWIAWYAAPRSGSPRCA